MKDYIRDVFLWGMFIGLGTMVSCQDDAVVTHPSSTDRVEFTVSGDTAVASRISTEASYTTGRHFLGMAGKDSVFISMTEEVNEALNHPLSNNDAHARSASFTDQNFDSFLLSAFVEDGSEFMKDQSVTRNTGTGNCEYSPVKYWPQTQPVHFFGYAKMNNNGILSIPVFSIQGKNYTGEFSYALPVAGTDGKDAENQPDLVFAITPNQHKEVVHLPFKHALSAILFKIAGKPEDITLSNVDIRLSSVSTKGDCSLKYIDATTLDFTWNGVNHSGTYKQAFQYTSTAPSYLNYDANESQTFMMIPQALTEAKLGVVFSYNGVNYDMEIPLKDIHTEWEANKKYTYTISIKETVEVFVDDTVSGNVKSNVTIRNTGLSDAYIRATIVGYWENAEGNVVDWWDSANETDGTFVKDANWSNYWIQDGDFYYYKYPVKVGNTPSVPLFKTYTLERTDAPAGATLKLNIVVQAVRYEDDKKSLTDAWGENMSAELKNFISKTFESMK